jgi:hypothetical protein
MEPLRAEAQFSLTGKVNEIQETGGEVPFAVLLLGILVQLVNRSLGLDDMPIPPSFLKGGHVIPN